MVEHDQAGSPRSERFGDVVLAGALFGPEGKLGLRADCGLHDKAAERQSRPNGKWGAARVDGYRAVVASPEIDAVAVVARVPSHYAPAKAALEAGKHVYCEWPLGRTMEEALELAALAKSTGRVTAVGLQARVNPALMYMRELVACCYVGEIRAVHVRLLRDGVLARPKHRAWQRDASLGANTLTIPNGHTVDAMRVVAGDFARRSAVVATQVRQWRVTDANEVFEVTSPDNVLVSGWLTNGAVVSSHVGTIPYAGSNYRMAIYGRDGTTGGRRRGLSPAPHRELPGAQRGNTLAPLPVPSRFNIVRPGTPVGEAVNIGQLYAAFAGAIRGGSSNHPTFETTMAMHRVIDAMRQASDTGREVRLALAPTSSGAARRRHAHFIRAR